MTSPIGNKLPAVFFFLLICSALAHGTACCADAQPPLIPFEIRAVYPHDPEAFTQGLFYSDGFLFESTGLKGRSSLRRVDVETGKVLQFRPLPHHYFGEGIACVGSRIFQLTWQSKKGFIYDKKTFQPMGSFRYSTEGWGLTYDGSWLILSDGSDLLYFLDTATLKAVRKIRVHDDSGPVSRLNELEFVNGYIFANVLYSDNIYKIQPDTGRIVGRVDCTDLLMLRADKNRRVLNGIAYDKAEDRLFITGKLWPKLYEIRLKANPAE